MRRGRGASDGRRAGHGKNDLPRRLGEVLSPALDRLATSDQARAYAAWARAVGEQVATATRPKAFSRGRLTVECVSAVWAGELTYLSQQILRRMDEVAPGHPVDRFRFVVGQPRLDLPEATARDGRGSPSVAAPGNAAAVAVASSPRQENGASATKRDGQRQTPAPAPCDAARAQAEGVRDERLRAAIEAALRRSSGQLPSASVDDPPPG